MFPSNATTVAGNNLFAKAELTSSGRPVLIRNEVECHLLSSVDLESEDEPHRFPPFKSGLIILTTHRLIWLPSQLTTAVAGIAISLATVSHIFPLKKSIFHSPRVRFQVGSVVITAVVRGKGDCEGFYAKLWESWRGKAWENDADRDSASVSGSATGSVSGSGSGGGFYGSDGRVRMVGLAGILRKEQEMWESTDKSLQDAFTDLNALMSMAKEMVILAERMRRKLLSGADSQSSSTNDGDGHGDGDGDGDGDRDGDGDKKMSPKEMQDWLLSVGIVSPVTKESAGALYHQQLSRQLADFVRIPLERAGGMINLIDIYCVFNRARGTELISPEDLLLACSLWDKFDVPVMLRKFESGVMVIQNKSHSDEEVFARIRTLVTKPETLRAGISASDAAMTLGIAPAMAKEHLLSAESKGLLCRDISPDGFRFYVNLLSEIDPTHLYLVKDFSIYSTWVKATSVS